MLPWELIKTQIDFYCRTPPPIVLTPYEIADMMESEERETVWYTHLAKMGYDPAEVVHRSIQALSDEARARLLYRPARHGPFS